jgi:hypothetical protein
MSRKIKVLQSVAPEAKAFTFRVSTRRVLLVEDRRRLTSFYFLLMTIDRRRVRDKKSSSSRSTKAGQKCGQFSTSRLCQASDINLTRSVLRYLADESVAAA